MTITTGYTKNLTDPARPLPSAEELAIDGLTSEEWNALVAVLAER